MKNTQTIRREKKRNTLVIKPTGILPPMTRAEWEAQPDSFKFFHPWEEARKPLVIVTKAGTHG